ncbi:MAG TPA: amidophosphoribosyltransferase [Gammaproteobacteria bacterium]|nr:amidophosphoribosyltransferase [Gammaproteobacteria bacterium]|tara:strand:- start:1144 stop:2673 length:1530 start_codon:yes stop_codon:yes gene_type:complete
MCGIVGIVAKTPVNQALYDGLTVLQHRGQDAAGIATYEDGHLFLRKSAGYVRDVFRTRHMRNLRGRMGVGHVRYPTAGVSSNAEAQPFYVNSPYGITLAHNGNLTNSEQLKQELFEDDLRHINTDSDSEVLLNIFAHELKRLGKFRIESNDIFKAIEKVHQRCKGGYAAISMITGVGIIGFRDPHGIRPIVYGKRETDLGVEYMIASESVAIDVLGFELIGDIAPGEAIFISKEGELETKLCAPEKGMAPCIFEYVYLARPDSIIDGISVQQARMRMGEALARKIRREWGEHDIDVVIPIPDTSRTAALELAHELKVNYREGFVKNRYIPRTFIMPGQSLRRKSVRQKLNAISLEFENKNVLLVDDSIVRGTTSSQIIQMARDAGANKVYFASASPPVVYPNVYGIDMPTGEELIGSNRSVDEVGEIICADRIIYQDLSDLVDATRRGNMSVKRFDLSCFDGDYVTGDISESYLTRIESLRSDEAKSLRISAQNSLSDMHSSEEISADV